VCGIRVVEEIQISLQWGEIRRKNMERGRGRKNGDVNMSYDSQQSSDDTTPVIRPWNQIKQENGHEMKTEIMIPDHESNEDDGQYQSDDGGEEDDGEESDEKGNLRAPLTPSRLLTISSVTDFDGTSQQQQHYHHLQKGSYHLHTSKIFANAVVDQNPLGDGEEEEVELDLNLDLEIKFHDDLITDTMNQLNLTTQTHLQHTFQKLKLKYENLLHDKDLTITQQQTTHHQALKDLQILITSYENKLELQKRQTENWKLKILNTTFRRYAYFVSAFSVQRLFQEWKLSVVKNKIYPHLNRQAVHLYRKHLLTKTFHRFLSVAKASQAQRKYNLLATSAQRNTSELIEKYESHIATLQLEVSNSWQLFQKEKASKLHLEENLRRLFLKNMTVMNMSALSLFQDTDVTSGERDDGLPQPLWTTATGGPMPSSTQQQEEQMRLVEQQMRLEHERYLHEQKNLREAMRRQQQQLTSMVPSSSSSTGRSGTSEGRGAGELVAKEKSKKVSSSSSSPHGGNKKPLSTSSTPSSSTRTTKAPTPRQHLHSSSPVPSPAPAPEPPGNVFAITGPSYHSKALVTQALGQGRERQGQQVVVEERAGHDLRGDEQREWLSQRQEQWQREEQKQESSAQISQRFTSTVLRSTATTTHTSATTTSTSSTSRLDEKLFFSPSSRQLQLPPSHQPSLLSYQPIAPSPHPRHELHRDEQWQSQHQWQQQVEVDPGEQEEIPRPRRSEPVPLP
jgi:hypothetical protein